MYLNKCYAFIIERFPDLEVRYFNMGRKMPHPTIVVGDTWNGVYLSWENSTKKYTVGYHRHLSTEETVYIGFGRYAVQNYEQEVENLTQDWEKDRVFIETIISNNGFERVRTKIISMDTQV